VSGLFACGKDELSGAKAEVMETNIQLDLPTVPDFKVPKANPDGSHPVPEMRLKGKSYLDTDVRVKGTVLWIYDCGTAIRTPEMTDKDVQKLLEEEPERCTRPHMIIGETADSKVERGVEVVEYPRPLRKDEKKNMPDELLAEMESALAALPPFKVGDEVMISGTWALRSPKGFHNSEGLLVYKSMENLSAPATEE
jgi:hypothetical protein